MKENLDLTLASITVSFKSLLYHLVKRSFTYKKYEKQLRRSENALMETKKNNEAALKKILTSAKHCKVYNHRISSGTGIHDYPLIDKSIVREEPDGVTNPNYYGLYVKGGTSGTTGMPLQLKKSLDELRWEEAHASRQLRWMGCRWHEKSAWIRGDMVVSANKKRAPYWVRNFFSNTLMMSSYHLSDMSAKEYVTALQRFDPKYIQAYPSSICFLAKYLNTNNLKYGGSALVAILTSSETLTESAQNEIEAAFGVRVYDWYGNYERVAAIGTCEYGSRHVISDYSHVEIMPPDDDGLCEIVGTTLHNAKMPLIRYRTGDFVRGYRQSECPCSKPFPIVAEILGRCDDSIITLSGKSINRLDHIFKDAKGIIEAQIIQESISDITIRIVATDDYSEADGANIAKKMKDRVGEEMALEIDLVSSIPRTKNGKFRAVISNVNRD